MVTENPTYAEVADVAAEQLYQPNVTNTKYHNLTSYKQQQNSSFNGWIADGDTAVDLANTEADEEIAIRDSTRVGRQELKEEGVALRMEAEQKTGGRQRRVFMRAGQSLLNGASDMYKFINTNRNTYIHIRASDEPHETKHLSR